MKMEYVTAILLIIQLAILSWIATLDPVTEQGVAALLMALNFIITNIVLYLYMNRNKEFPIKKLALDEEWIAIGFAVIFLVILLIVFL